MALTATIVYVDANSAIYKVENTGSPLGTSVDITMTGAATPDLVTDGANNSFTGQGFGGRLKQVARAGLDGLGSQAAAGWTQAEARDLLFSDGSTLAGGPLMPRAKCFLTERAGVNSTSRSGPAVGVHCSARTATPASRTCTCSSSTRSRPDLGLGLLDVDGAPTGAVWRFRLPDQAAAAAQPQKALQRPRAPTPLAQDLEDQRIVPHREDLLVGLVDLRLGNVGASDGTM
jgi:hypothetical protein